ncbi:hypothetical protein [Sphingopyxis sp. LC81]|jgi:energy-converting hydrogenase Eha subunit E|uniref:hypothetical protein n=1 Tax=Sphingopyxis sp. LC81 TaxID=1502850 RepID=UPI00068F4E05|nr:hypothetical protein [Sphingopyxis sp. LC81]
MTLMIILGIAAALYLAWLMVRLASLALPVCLGVSAFFLLRDQGFGLAAAIAIGAITAIVLHQTGRVLLARSGSPHVRLLIISLFAIPAGVAGMEVGAALAHIIDIDGVWRIPFIVGFGILTARASWRLLVADQPSSGGRRRHPTFR